MDTPTVMNMLLGENLTEAQDALKFMLEKTIGVEMKIREQSKLKVSYAAQLQPRTKYRR